MKKKMPEENNDEVNFEQKKEKHLRLCKKKLKVIAFQQSFNLFFKRSNLQNPLIGNLSKF
jgi:hypothetical protein